MLILLTIIGMLSVDMTMPNRCKTETAPIFLVITVIDNFAPIGTLLRWAKHREI